MTESNVEQNFNSQTIPDSNIPAKRVMIWNEKNELVEPELAEHYKQEYHLIVGTKHVSEEFLAGIREKVQAEVNEDDPALSSDEKIRLVQKRIDMTSDPINSPQPVYASYMKPLATSIIMPEKILQNEQIAAGIVPKSSKPLSTIEEKEMLSGATHVQQLTKKVDGSSKQVEPVMVALAVDEFELEAAEDKAALTNNDPSFDTGKAAAISNAADHNIPLPVVSIHDALVQTKVETKGDDIKKESDQAKQPAGKTVDASGKAVTSEDKTIKPK